MNKSILVCLFAMGVSLQSSAQYSVSGNVTDVGQNFLQGVRITLFSSDTLFFKETRTDNTGYFLIANVPSANYTLGLALPEKQYRDTLLSVSGSIANLSFTLATETQQGQWDIIMNSPERLGGTDLGVLMPDGKIFYCHDTEDPFYFDPVANDTVSVIGSDSIQGCVGPILSADSSVWFFGGTLQAVYGPGTKKVKSFNQPTGNWQFKNLMSDYRWYPTVSPLPNGNILIAGGGGLNNPVRVNTSEVYNISNGSTTPVDVIAIGNEVSPVVPLLNGKTLMTHRPPQLFDPATNQWNLAADFVQSNRMSNGDHSDHELVLMPNGNVFAFGYKPFNNPLGTFVEMYDPLLSQWSLKSSINPIRSRAKAIILPDKKIVVAAGEKEDASNFTSVNQWNYMARCDLYNPALDTWRSIHNMNYFREYHCIITLVPDGRLIAVGGEGQPGNEPPQSIIEAYKPPYLFRGVRPEISNLSSYSFDRGSQFTFNVSKTDSITGLHLMANAVNTHFMNSSSNRFIELNFTQNNGTVTATLPADSLVLFPGFYMLFAMVDDIPSVAQIIQVTNSTVTIPTALHELEKVQFAVYPNPSNQIFKIDAALPVTHAILTDMMGRKILEETSPLRAIDLGSAEEGIYFLHLQFQNNVSATTKILKVTK